jgi:hypothetical protein
VNAGTIATVVLAVVAILGLVAAGIGWLFRRGADEKELSIAIRDNTSATRELSGDFRSFKDWTVGQLHDHDIRLTKIEAPPHDRHSAHRDAGSKG